MENPGFSTDCRKYLPISPDLSEHTFFDWKVMRTWGSSCLGPRDFHSAVGECYRINMLWIWNHSSLLYLPPTSWPDIQRCGHHAKLHIIISPRYVGPDLKTWNFQGHCLKECSSRLRPSVASYPKLQLSMTLTLKRNTAWNWKKSMPRDDWRMAWVKFKRLGPSKTSRLKGSSKIFT